LKALTKASRLADDVALLDRPRPEPALGHVLLQVTAVGLCGSDVHAIKADPGYEWVSTPVTLGHEITGVVAAVAADVDPELLGRRVSVISMDGCRSCDLCIAERRPLCADRTVIGLSYDGGAAEYAIVRGDNLITVPAEVSWKHAVLLEPFSVAAHAVALTPMPADGRVIISGAGPIAILAAFVARARTADVTIVGVEQDEAIRLPLLRQCGFEATTSLPARSAGAWIEASGSVDALAVAIESLRAGGHLTAVGMYNRLASINGSRIVRREISFRGSYGSVRADYLTAMDLLLRSDIPAESLVTPFRLEDWPRALDSMAHGEVIKAALTP